VQTVTILDAVEQGLVEKIKKLSQPGTLARQEWLDEAARDLPRRGHLERRVPVPAVVRPVVAADLRPDPGVRGGNLPLNRRPGAAAAVG
jgi:hypothetical protein